MVRAGLGYLAAVDAAQLPAATQAGCLRELEQHDAMATAARAGFLGNVHRRAGTRRGRGLQRGLVADPPDRHHPRGRRRSFGLGQAGGHASAGAGGAGGGAGLRIGGSADLPVDRQAARRLPGPGRRAVAGRLRRGAGAGGPGRAVRRDVRAVGDLPDQYPSREFADREVKLATTIGGAGVMHGDLTAGLRRGGGGGAGCAGGSGLPRG